MKTICIIFASFIGEMLLLCAGRDILIISPMRSTGHPETIKRRTYIDYEKPIYGKYGKHGKIPVGPIPGQIMGPQAV